MDHAQSEHMRKTLTGAAMIGAPVCFLIADGLWPAWGTEAAELLDEATGATTRMAVAGAIGLLGTAFLMAAVFGLAHMLHERRPGIALVGGGMATAGTLAVAAVIGVQCLVMFEAAQPGRDPGAMVAYIDALLMGSAMPLFAATFLLTIGMIVLAVGLFRAQVVAPWSAVLVMVASVVMGAGYPAGIQAIVLIGEAVMIAGLGSIGFTILTETDEEWAHPPVFHGFGRPVAA